jgi:hypothetical protein
MRHDSNRQVEIDKDHGGGTAATELTGLTCQLRSLILAHILLYWETSRYDS